jgi:iron complex transport system ATP-binding protein
VVAQAFVVELRGVSYGVHGVTIVDDVSIRFRSGCFNVVLGPNGAGKSTLLRMASGLLPPTEGEVLYRGESVGTITLERLARMRSVLSQHMELAFPLAVRDVVLMGRYPHYDRTPRAADREIVRHTLDLVGMTARAEQSYDTLSGGERQKVQLARVLAQIWRDERDAPAHRVLFLDEPTSNLDVHHQLWLLDLTRDLVRHDCTVVAILHDLNVALEYGEHFVLLDAGRVALEAERADDIPREVVERVFRVKARRIESADAARPYWRFSL